MSKTGTQYQPDQLRGHADEHDGIEEYDNKLPAWWVGLFIFTIIWAIGVFIDWHVVTPKTLGELHAKALEERGLDGPSVDVDSIEVVVNEESIQAGAQVYQSYCVPCHGADGTGGIGQDLTDDEWVHGGSLEAIRNTIALGVLDKGMPEWLPVVGPDGVANVTAYVASINPSVEQTSTGDAEASDESGAGEAPPAAEQAAPATGSQATPGSGDAAGSGAAPPDATTP